jgi:hypothetical protein
MSLRFVRSKGFGSRLGKRKEETAAFGEVTSRKLKTLKTKSGDDCLGWV